ncbi:hypothetical protein V6N12_024735 [Hibiscus sabdariffa]|uniref:Reverse transcriptase Ty1/copia-type domain-containing protein n=1 Tax=Hibiscus sabdariffa TaxID=183260 RepID=A0ABR2BFW3_9ROSI
MVRSMMSNSDFPTSFWGHALETTAFTLNRVPSKSVQKTPYEIWTRKRPSMPFMKVWGCKAHVKHQMSTKLEPKSHKCTFVGYPKETKDEPKNYQEVVSSPDSKKWLEAMRSEMDSMSINQTYKRRLVAKGFRKIHGVDYDETFSPIAMFKSIRILLAIAAFHDYEIWKMDVKTAFLNGKTRGGCVHDITRRFCDSRKCWKAIGSIMYAMICTRPELSYALSMTSRYQANPGEGHWTKIHDRNRILYFVLMEALLSWKSSKQDTVAYSTTEAECIAASEVAKEIVWSMKFISEPKGYF